MTEYDFSPDAWEQFRAQQEQVGRWAVEASRHSHEFQYPIQENIADYRGESRRRARSSARERPHLAQPLPPPPEHWRSKFNKSSQSVNQLPPTPEPSRHSSGSKRSRSHSRSRSAQVPTPSSSSQYIAAPPVPGLPPRPVPQQAPYHTSPYGYPSTPHYAHQRPVVPVHTPAPYVATQHAFPVQQPAAVHMASPVSPGKQPPLLKRVLGNIIGRGRTPAPEPHPENRSKSRSKSRSRRKSVA